MILEEKVGVMFIQMVVMNEDGFYNDILILSELVIFFFEVNIIMIVWKLMNYFNIF